MRIKTFGGFIIAAILISCRTEIKQPKDIDIYISDVQVIDGSGNVPYQAFVGVAGDEIVYLSPEPLKGISPEQHIDGKGKVITPGFIDLHSHGNPLKTPEFANFLAMGVTTISLGQDGASPAMLDIQTWMDQVDEKGIGPNLAMFVGHGTLRHLSGIGNEPSPSPEQIQSLVILLEQNLPHVFGLSTGLEYTPGLYASKEELLTLAQTVGKYDRMISSHMRNEDDDQLKTSIKELMAQGQYCRVHISHLKSVYGKGNDRALEILSWIKQARQEGISITADVYPYNASYTSISILYPDWAKIPDQFKLAVNTRRAELEKYLIQKVNSRNGPEATLLGTEPYKGKTLAQLEKEFNQPFEKVLIDRIGLNAAGAYFVMDDSLQATLTKDPLIALCSDGSPTGHHPRGHGSFAKLIRRFVLEDKVLTLQEAIRKVTSYPAQILGLPDRGQIVVGAKADLLIFDPINIKDKATYPDPLQLAEGFETIIINGQVKRLNGKFIDGRPGKVLKPESL